MAEQETRASRSGLHMCSVYFKDHVRVRLLTYALLILPFNPSLHFIARQNLSNKSNLEKEIIFQNLTQKKFQRVTN